MPNLVPDALSHVFRHGLQEFKADKELEGSLVERFVGRWCEIVLLSQKPTFGGGVFYFCSKTKWKRWWILWKRILLQGKSELEWMKLFDFFGSLATYINIICANHENLRAHLNATPQGNKGLKINRLFTTIIQIIRIVAFGGAKLSFLMAPSIHQITWGFAGCWASRSFFGLCSERPAGWPRGRGVLGSFWRSPKRANWETPKKSQGESRHFHR